MDLLQKRCAVYVQKPLATLNSMLYIKVMAGALGLSLRLLAPRPLRAACPLTKISTEILSNL